MTAQIVQSPSPITLLGGGTVNPADLAAALRLAPTVVAADGGANMALAEGLVLEAVIGDLDSLSGDARGAIPADRIWHIPEQDSTDFEKCLTRITAPYILGLGFSGPRSDHALSVWNALVRNASRPCLVLGGDDVVFAAPRRMRLDLAPGTRVSLFPMVPVRGQSLGLRWPIDTVDFAPGGRIGTSNEALGPVDLTFDRAGMLAILPREALSRAIDAVTQASRW